MEHFTAVQNGPKAPVLQEAWPPSLQNDPQWKLAQRVVAGPHFAHSPLLSKFLLFVVAETLKGHGNEITEHQIGVQVFDRPADYRTLEDNIVRNYARQLRKRLAEHFAGEGNSEPLRIDIPLGGYVPVFVQTSEDSAAGEAHSLSVPISVQTKPVTAAAQGSGQAIASGWNWKQWLLGIALAVAYSAALICLTWFIAARTLAPRLAPGPVHPLWATLFGGPANSYIVPSDAGFNLLEDLSHRSVPLAEYINGSYLGMPLGGVDAHSAQDLHFQQLSSFIDFQIVAALSRLPENDPQRVFIRFPRDLRLDDLKHANAVIIGSVDSNPWAAIGEPSANFRIVSRQGMQGATIVNLKPQPGEAASYASHWNEPAHETFALIAFLPNLSGNGHLLFLQGLDAAGTQAAAEMLFHHDALAPILKRAMRPDGSLRNFEVLLRSTSIEANATGTQVIASRIY
jgi:hypothetical protein